MASTLARSITISVLALLLLSSVIHAQRSAEPNVAIYRVDPQTSDIRLVVYRDGVLSTFGHNHLVSLHDFTGSIYLQPKLAESRVELDIPVDGLIVDDVAARRQEGPDFASQPSESDITGTRTNMLSNALLKSKQFPSIKVTGTTGPVDVKNYAMLELSVQLVGREIRLTIPATLKLEGDELEASGQVDLSHKQLGLKPFTALLGSLRVAENMKFKYRIRAQKESK